MAPAADADDLRKTFEELIEKALGMGPRRLLPIEVRELADGLVGALDAHIERRLRSLTARTEPPCMSALREGNRL